MGRRLKISLAHAVGPALGAVLRPVLNEAITRPAHLIHGRSWQPEPASEQVGMHQPGAAHGRQLYAGNNARSARCGLNGICQEIHGSRVATRPGTKAPKASGKG